MNDLEEKILEAISNIKNDKVAVLMKWNMLYNAVHEIHWASHADTCRYCSKYDKLPLETSCKGCPITKKVGVIGCEKTPFKKVNFKLGELKVAIREEIAFLETINEKEEEEAK